MENTDIRKRGRKPLDRPEGKDYLVRDIPRDLWRKLRIRSAEQDVPVRTIIVDLLERHL